MNNLNTFQFIRYNLKIVENNILYLKKRKKIFQFIFVCINYMKPNNTKKYSTDYMECFACGKSINLSNCNKHLQGKF